MIISCAYWHEASGELRSLAIRTDNPREAIELPAVVYGTITITDEEGEQ